MAGFSAELPNELIKSFQELETNTEEMLGEMTKAGAEVVYKQRIIQICKNFSIPSLASSPAWASIR